MDQVLPVAPSVPLAFVSPVLADDLTFLILIKNNQLITTADPRRLESQTGRP
jgi:hypothetical protein